MGNTENDRQKFQSTSEIDRDYHAFKQAVCDAWSKTTSSIAGTMDAGSHYAKGYVGNVEKEWREHPAKAAAETAFGLGVGSALLLTAPEEAAIIGGLFGMKTLGTSIPNMCDGLKNTAKDRTTLCDPASDKNAKDLAHKHIEAEGKNVGQPVVDLLLLAPGLFHLPAKIKIGKVTYEAPPPCGSAAPGIAPKKEALEIMQPEPCSPKPTENEKGSKIQGLIIDEDEVSPILQKVKAGGDIHTACEELSELPRYGYAYQLTDEMERLNNAIKSPDQKMMETSSGRTTLSTMNLDYALLALAKGSKAVYDLDKESYASKAVEAIVRAVKLDPKTIPTASDLIYIAKKLDPGQKDLIESLLQINK